MRSFPFTAQSGDRKVTTADFRELFKKYFTNGVFMNPSTNFQVLENVGMMLTVKKGWGNINGTFAYSNDDITLNLQSAESNPRIDRVVLRFNDNVEERKINVYVVKGISSINPTAPALTRSESIYELSLATIYVNSYATNITQSKITDTRLDASVCGVVAGTIKEADTTTLYTQIQNDLKGFKQNEQEEFIKWFNQIKGQLSTDQAGNLQNQIDEIKPKLEKNTNTLNGLAPMNLLINGDFQINQRGIKEYKAINLEYTLDMWAITRMTLTVLDDGWVRIVNNDSIDSHGLNQKIKDTNVGKYICCLNVRNMKGVARLSITYPGERYETVATLTEGRNEIKFTPKEKFTKINIALNASASIEIEYINLFEGDNAYPYVKEDYSIALARCQRYVYVTSLSATGYTGSKGTLYIPLKQNLIDKPTIIIKGKVDIYANGRTDYFTLFNETTFQNNELKLVPRSIASNLYNQAFGIIFENSIILTCEPL